MSVKRLEPPPRTWIAEKGESVRGLWERWFNRITSLMPFSVTVTWNPAAVAANSTAEQTVTVNGARTGDAVVVTKPTHTAGVAVAGARVSAKDTVKVTFVNPTASSVDPPSEDYRFTIIR